MRITINPVLDMETLQFVSNDGTYEYNGPVVLCLGGESEGDSVNRVSEQEFMKTLQAEQGTQFANEQDAQNQVKQMWDPIAKGGAYQYGFSTAEDQQLQANIENAGAQQTTNTINAAELRQQQAQGNTSAAPTGANEALTAQLAQTQAQSTAQALGQEKELGYETGRENFEKASDAETQIAQLSNPTGYASSATGAAGAANQAQATVDTANANSLGSKLLGGAIGAIPGIAGSVAQGLSGGGGASDVASSLAGMFV